MNKFSPFSIFEIYINSNMFYSELLDELNSIVKPNCIEYKIIDHEFPDWCSSTHEFISEMDCINYRWELQKEIITRQPQVTNMCDCECRKVVDSEGYHHSCDLVLRLKNLIKIHTLD